MKTAPVSSGRIPRRLVLCWLVCVAPWTTARAQSPPVEIGEKEGERGVLLVSTSASPGVYAPIKEAKQTVLAPAYVSPYGIRVYGKDDWAKEGIVWNEFFTEATRKADAVVDQMEPDFKRDIRGVIDYALVEHRSPWLSSALLSKRFLPRFEREFGRRLHVVVIDRHRLYVFPADAGKLDGYGEALIKVYHDRELTKYPVSLEVFLVDETGFRAIGSIEN